MLFFNYWGPLVVENWRKHGGVFLALENSSGSIFHISLLQRHKYVFLQLHFSVYGWSLLLVALNKGREFC